MAPFSANAPQPPRRKNEKNRILALALGVCAIVAAIAAAGASAHHDSWQHPTRWHHHHPTPPPHHPGTLTANADNYSTGKQATLAVEGPQGVLANDHGDEPTLVANTEPLHGSLELEPDGGFIYMPEAGFSGTDSFSYSIADAVHLYKTDLPPIGTFGGVTADRRRLRLLALPGPRPPGRILRPRGPRPQRRIAERPRPAIEPKPVYDPAIARFRFDEGKAELVEEIPLRDAPATRSRAWSTPRRRPARRSRT